MNSFYGGKPGFSFVITKSFESVAAMTAAFAQGSIYTEVEYNEHVIINTENKNSPDNGKIFTRGTDTQSELGGAIYIGTIVGPAGHAPMLEISTIEDVAEKEGFKERRGEGSYSVTNNSLVPGKVGNSYNDAIEWNYCSVRDENENDTIAYLGFKIPYMVVEASAESVPSHYDRPLVTRTDNRAHPFFQSFKFFIPKGVKGESIENVRVEVANDDIQAYPGQAGDISAKKQVFVCDIREYAENGTSLIKTFYIAPYNTVKDVEIAGNGAITVSYSYKATETLSHKVRWISNVEILTGAEEGTGTQRVKVTYNDNTSMEIGSPINYILETAMTDDFHYIVRYSDPARRAKIVAAKRNYTYNGKNDWHDLGAVKDETGILVGQNLKPSDIAGSFTIPNIIAHLNKVYPTGMLTGLLKGKIVCAGNENDEKRMFAFDYARKEWFYLGIVSAELQSNMIASENDSDLESKKANLMIGGIWFILEE